MGAGLGAGLGVRFLRGMTAGVCCAVCVVCVVCACLLAKRLSKRAGGGLAGDFLAPLAVGSFGEAALEAALEAGAVRVGRMKEGRAGP